MSTIINKITLTKKYPNCPWEVGDVILHDCEFTQNRPNIIINGVTVYFEDYPENFQIKYKPEPTPKKRWRAGYNKKYYSLENNDSIWINCDIRINSDNFRYSTGNYFQTEEEAQNYRDKLIINQRLADLALELNDGWVANWSNRNQNKFYPFYDHNKNNFRVSWNDDYQPFSVPVFHFRELAEKALDTLLAKFGEEKLKKALLN